MAFTLPHKTLQSHRRTVDSSFTKNSYSGQTVEVNEYPVRPLGQVVYTGPSTVMQAPESTEEPAPFFQGKKKTIRSLKARLKARSKMKVGVKPAAPSALPSFMSSTLGVKPLQLGSEYTDS